MGGMRLGLQAGQPLCVEGVNCFPHTLVTTVELDCHVLGSLALAAGRKNMTALESEGVGGAPPLLEGRQFFLSNLLLFLHAESHSR